MAELQSRIPLIEDVILFHGCRGRLSPLEREEFRSFAIEKLLESDCARLRKFEGRSSLRSFVSVVVADLLVDWESLAKRRRPSSPANRFAPEGVWLERYLGGGYRVSEAIERVKANHRSPLSEDELFHIVLRLPPRRSRPLQVAESLADDLGSDADSPERLFEARDENASRARIEEELLRALSTLSREERIYVQMRFEDGSKINEIAKAFHLPEKSFYRRFQRTLRRLRRELESSGVDAGCLWFYRDSEPPAANRPHRAPSRESDVSTKCE